LSAVRQRPQYTPRVIPDPVARTRHRVAGVEQPLGVTGSTIGSPPACVTVMEFDPLRDEGLHYAQRLLQAGVSVELHAYPGTFHGSSLITDAAISRRQWVDTCAALARGLGLPPTV
jgi:acetyl esterase/lipase